MWDPPTDKAALQFLHNPGPDPTEWTVIEVCLVYTTEGSNVGASCLWSMLPIFTPVHTWMIRPHQTSLRDCLGYKTWPMQTLLSEHLRSLSSLSDYRNALVQCILASASLACLKFSCCSSNWICSDHRAVDQPFFPHTDSRGVQGIW